ncbi:MAG: hypothetical protein ACK4ND_04350 [Cytophagaceae bacterium]
MKKVTFKILTLAVLTSWSGITANATERVPGDDPKKTEVVRTEEHLMDRLEEIKAIDKSDLTKEEKKELRKEIKGIKQDLKAQGGGAGIYISGGALLLAIILLIILL